MLFSESETWPQVAQVAGVFNEPTFIRRQIFQELYLLRVHVRVRNSRTSPNVLQSTSSSSTPISSRDWISTLQQVIAGLTACQTSIQDLLKIVESSNERIKDLLTLDDKLSSDEVVDADAAVATIGVESNVSGRKLHFFFR